MPQSNDHSLHDEQTLARVLEAAYIMQEHNRARQKPQSSKPKLEPMPLRTPEPELPVVSLEMLPLEEASPQAKAGISVALSEIAEIQHKIQVQRLDLESAMSLIVERTPSIFTGSSAAIGILEGGVVHYRAATGALAIPRGTRVPMQKALSADSLRYGQVFRYADVNSELLLDGDECRRRGIQSMLAVPVFRHGVAAGALEVYFSTRDAFTEEDVHTFRLMAGLITETLARSSEAVANNSTESLGTLQIPELSPNIVSLPDDLATHDAAPQMMAAAVGRAASKFVCSKCGHELLAQEQFCGNCGSPRAANRETPKSGTTPWHMQDSWNAQTGIQSPANVPGIQQELESSFGVQADDTEPESLSAQVIEPYAAKQPISEETSLSAGVAQISAPIDYEVAAHADLEIAPQALTRSKAAPEEQPEGQTQIEQVEGTASVTSEPVLTWRSAARTRDFLEQLAAAKNPGAWANLWNTRRGDIYLAIAVVLLLGVIRWATWSSDPVSAVGNPTAAAHHQAAPEDNLPLFERILVKLGLAELPDPPVYKGNPRTQVWEDLHTAQYYCPGDDLYGKTTKGKFSSQRDAQLDQFEPAYRKACE